MMSRGFLKYHHTESYISVLQEYVVLMPNQCPSHGDAGFSSWTCQRAAVFDHHNWRRRWVDGDHYCSWFSCWWFRKHLHVMFKLLSWIFCCCLPPGIEGIVNNNSALQNICYNSTFAARNCRNIQEDDRTPQLGTCLQEACNWKHGDSIACARSGNHARPHYYGSVETFNAVAFRLRWEWWYVEGGHLPSKSECSKHRAHDIGDITWYSGYV